MTLKLNKNQIGDEGARSLANALQNNTVGWSSMINYLPLSFHIDVDNSESRREQNHRYRYTALS
jgi:hypothetical protein